MKKTIGLLLLAMLFALPTKTALSFMGVLTVIFALGYFFYLTYSLVRLSLLLGGLNDYW